MARMKRFRDKMHYFFGQSNAKCAANTLGGLLGARAGLATALANPSSLQVEVTNRCNLNCQFCSRSVTDLSLGDLSPAVIDQVVRLSATAQEVALFGYGEPLMSRAFFALLPQLRSSHFMFFTNGLLLDAKLLDRILGQAARPLSSIVFSVDGSTKATYESIRVGSDFDRVWRNIREVVDLRDRRGLDMEIRLEFVAMRSNVRELPGLIEMAADAGLDGVKASHLVVWGEGMRDESLVYQPALCGEAFAAARHARDRCGVWLDLPKDFSRLPPAGPLPPCRLPWQYAMISYEGDIRACCFAPELTMGNLTTEPFDAIWNNKAYKALRRVVNGAAPPAACLRCEERLRECASPDEEATYVKLKPRTK